MRKRQINLHRFRAAGQHHLRALRIIAAVYLSLGIASVVAYCTADTASRPAVVTEVQT